MGKRKKYGKRVKKRSVNNVKSRNGSRNLYSIQGCDVIFNPLHLEDLGSLIEAGINLDAITAEEMPVAAPLMSEMLASAGRDGRGAPTLLNTSFSAWCDENLMGRYELLHEIKSQTPLSEYEFVAPPFDHTQYEYCDNCLEGSESEESDEGVDVSYCDDCKNADWSEDELDEMKRESWREFLESELNEYYEENRPSNTVFMSDINFDEQANIIRILLMGDGKKKG